MWAYAQVTATRMLPGPEGRHSDTEEVSGKRSVHPGNERTLTQGQADRTMRFRRSEEPAGQQPDLCTDLCTRRGGTLRDGGDVEA